MPPLTHIGRRGSSADGARLYATTSRPATQPPFEPFDLASEGLEMALDTVVAAANSALDIADKTVEAEINKITGGVKLPGMT